MPNSDNPAADGSGSAKIIYFLYGGALIFALLAVVGVVMAYVSRKDAATWVAGHCRFQIRTFWIGVFYSSIWIGLLHSSSDLPVAFMTPFILAGLLVAVAVWIWWLVRVIKGLQYLRRFAPYPNAGSWLW